METTVSPRRNSSAYAMPGVVRRPPKPEEIDKVVARHYGLNVEDLSVKTRKREIVEPRQIAMYMNELYTKESLKDIGRRYGKDHATVLHASKTVINLKETDRHFSAIVETIVEKLASAYVLKVFNRAQGLTENAKS